MGCNVENASFGVTLCAECGLVSDLHRTGGGTLLAVVVLVARPGRAADAVRPVPPAADGGGRPRPPGRRARRARDARPVAALRLHATTSRTRAVTGRTPSTSSAPSATAAALTDEQIRWFLAAYTAGEVADEQAAALLHGHRVAGPGARRAVGVDRRHDRLRVERLDLSTVGRPTVDKHSTGGVGDKVSLALVPARRRLRGGRAPARPGGASATPAARSTSSRPCPGCAVALAGAEVLAQLLRPRGRLRRLRRRPRPRPRRPQALRPPGRHRHRGVHPADRLARSCRRRSPRAPGRWCSTSRWAAAPS